MLNPWEGRLQLGPERQPQCALLVFVVLWCAGLLVSCRHLSSGGLRCSAPPHRKQGVGCEIRQYTATLHWGQGREILVRSV